MLLYTTPCSRIDVDPRIAFDYTTLGGGGGVFRVIDVMISAPRVLFELLPLLCRVPACSPLRLRFLVPPSQSRQSHKKFPRPVPTATQAPPADASEMAFSDDSVRGERPQEKSPFLVITNPIHYEVAAVDSPRQELPGEIDKTDFGSNSTIF